MIGYERRTFRICSCSGFARSDVSRALIREGYFPTQPTEPQMAISIDFLQFLIKLSHRSGDAVTAVAHTMKDFYSDRGYPMLHLDVSGYFIYLLDNINVDLKGRPMNDPIRRGLGYVMKWFVELVILLDKRVEEVLQAAAQRLEAFHLPPANPPSSVSQASESNEVPQPPRTPKPHSACDTLLVDRCPACFGGSEFGGMEDK